MRTIDRRPYRWYLRNLDHAGQQLSSQRERKAGIWMFTGVNRATTRILRSNTGPRPLYSRIAPFEQIGWKPGFRQYTHPRSPHS